MHPRDQVVGGDYNHAGMWWVWMYNPLAGRLLHYQKEEDIPMMRSLTCWCCALSALLVVKG